MAEIPMSGHGMPAQETSSLTPLVNWAGAALSLGLIVGAGIWGYKLMVRDVTGVPVVRAVEGPMRIQPDDPGGARAAHQGLSVNTVAAEGGAGKPADRLVLAPAPIRLDEEDAAGAPEISIDKAQPVATEGARADIVAPPPLSTDKIGDIESFATRLAGDASPLSKPEPVTVKAPTVEEPETAPKVAGGIGRSLRPKLRPATLGQKAPDVATRADTSAVNNDLNAVPAGTRMVQLGAFASAEIARTEWGKLTARYGDYLNGKDRVIQKASSGGRTFYRLRAMGFVDLSDARRLCSALKAEGADCIPVTAR